MKVGFVQCAIVSAVFAIIGYLVFSSVDSSAFPPLAVALSVLFGGIVSPYAASLLGSKSVINSTQQQTDGEASTLYVGNLPYRANEDDVRSFFSDYITVQSVRLMKDRKTGKRKGYGFVEIVSDDIDSVIGKLNDSVFQDRTLKVRPAKDKNND